MTGVLSSAGAAIWNASIGEDIAAVKSSAFETRVLTRNREAAARKYRNFMVDRTSIEEIMVLYGRGEEQ